MMKALAALAVLLAAGCDLYLGGDDTGDDVCGYATDGEGMAGSGTADGGAADGYYELRDPNTGVCQPFGGGGYDCDDRCGPCPLTDDVQPPDWGACYGTCSGLDEQGCRLTAGCYAAYLEDTSIDDAQPTREFWGCWETAPSGPIEGGQCLNFGAYECSRHDDCLAVYDSSFGTSFLSCEPELSPPPPPACETLVSETACTARTDCTPVYAGQDCTCYPWGCECQVQTYERCETAGKL